MPGIRQRLAAANALTTSLADDAPVGIEFQSNLGTRLLLQWSKGSISASEVQRLAHAAVLDGLLHHEIASLASIGNWGQMPGNCNRDLQRKYHIDYLPAPLVVRVPCIAPKAVPAEMIWADAAIMLPHQWVASIAILPQAESLLGFSHMEAFWNGVSAKDPRLKSWPCKYPSPANTKEKWLPLFLHGDGVEYASGQSLMVVTIGSVLTTTNSQDSMFYLASWPKSCTASKKKGHSEDTWDELWAILAWSLEALYHGVHPSADWTGQAFGDRPEMKSLAELAGKPIMQGNRFVVWNLVGDLEHYANNLKLPHWNSHNLCWHCDCSRVEEDKDWKVCWKGKGWELKDPATYQFPSPHPIFQVPGVSSWSVCFDMLHCLDCNGVGSLLVASCLHQLLFEAGGGAARANQKLVLLWRRVQELYKEFDVKERLSHLHLNMVCYPKSPHANFMFFKAKAAETRHLVPMLAKVAQEMDTGSEVSKHRIAALHCLTLFYQVCDSRPMFMHPDAARKAQQLMEALLGNYFWLHKEAIANSKHLYKYVPKCHYSWHLAYTARWMNPRFTWTYKCESWVGKISFLACSCAHGTSLAKLSIPVAEKYRYMVHFRLSRAMHED